MLRSCCQVLLLFYLFSLFPVFSVYGRNGRHGKGVKRRISRSEDNFIGDCADEDVPCIKRRRRGFHNRALVTVDSKLPKFSHIDENYWYNSGVINNGIKLGCMLFLFHYILFLFLILILSFLFFFFSFSLFYFFK